MAIEVKRNGSYLVILKLNDIEILPRELIYCEMLYELGNVMPRLTVEIVTQRHEVYENFMQEMSTIECEMGMLDSSGGVIDSKKGRYFTTKPRIQGQYEGISGRNHIRCVAFADGGLYLEKNQIRSVKVIRKSVEFLPQVKGIGSGAKGTYTLDCQVKDNLLQRAADKMKWIEHDMTGMETVNQILSRSQIVDGAEWVVTAVIDFKDDNSGDPCLFFYDLKLRTQTFGPEPVKVFERGASKTMFTFKEVADPQWISYATCKPNIKSAADSASYNGREAAVYDLEEGLFHYKKTKQPMLFQDSQTYVPQTQIDGFNPNPSEYPIFTSNERFQIQFLSSNHHSPQYVTQGIQTIAAHASLTKIQMELSFPRKFIKAKPIDICTIEYQKSDNVNNRFEVDRRLSTNYMITMVAHVFQNQMMSTYIIASRDSFSNKGMDLAIPPA